MKFGAVVSPINLDRFASIKENLIALKVFLL